MKYQHFSLILLVVLLAVLTTACSQEEINFWVRFFNRPHPNGCQLFGGC